MSEVYFIAEVAENPKRYRIREVSTYGDDQLQYQPLFIGSQEECHAELNKIKNVDLP